ncbi:uncharacterized protein K460DRAFT_427416 [Cucurbitaria berberidis CBS 394.84]|uniref:Trichothecene 3-O-acetyltransferase-like N-terminal domain-containing protein n=1 Tax=Cucurbitaria berberidis CBS 394.84 TaxID=1168544 RepID=A0A9P4LBH1_9PLEO|nr:uncharacterized protein K460DRAFT_427416 [Cucurbitaria berberidis CBS 394.84]KAF1848362.1 hypothetical protein K460DRAFT_427416 [Cucurbitaria berberidis CBS 394.84]
MFIRLQVRHQPHKIRPFAPVPHLTVRDYSNDASILTLEQIADAGFPMSMLGEEMWARRPWGLTHRNPLGLRADEPAPVMLVQTSFIGGIVVLCELAIQHVRYDRTGGRHGCSRQLRRGLYRQRDRISNTKR